MDTVDSIDITLCVRENEKRKQVRRDRLAGPSRLVSNEGEAEAEAAMVAFMVSIDHAT
jgi:hypothetical protein